MQMIQTSVDRNRLGRSYQLQFRAHSRAIGWNWKTALWDEFERQFPSRVEFANRLGSAGITNETTVIINGAPVQFGTYAWWVFKYFGQNDVRILDGGQEKWEAEGYPISKSIPDIAPIKYIPGRTNENIRVGRDDVLRELNNPDCSILDHRSYEECSGKLAGLLGKPDVGAERYGRIPGASHVPFESLLNGDTTFKSSEELREILSKTLQDENQNIISYCRLAHRATLASFAMTEILGYRNVRVYDGSWTEWGGIVGFPIER